MKTLNKNINSLIITQNYHNTLDIEGFSRMMKDPSYSYKFYWLEAIVKLISEDFTVASYDEIIDEMITNAWYPIVEYHIHLSGIFIDGITRDNLEKAVIKLQSLSKLQAKSSKIEIKNAIKEFSKELHPEKMGLTKNVPYKALSGFANKKGDRINLESSAGRLMEYYNRLSSKEILLPYTFGEEKGLSRKIHFNEPWLQMIKDNIVSILGWIQCEKAKWLQGINPEVPGIIYKLDMSGEKARKLANVRKLWDEIITIKPVRDVFTGEEINKESYDVDHFIPWSFIMNDELWNLMPMDSCLNSSKSNKLPAWKDFFLPFANNQYIMYDLINNKEEIHKHYRSCYKYNLHSIWASQELYRKGNSKEKFQKILEVNMKPVYDSARRQGYELWDRRADYDYNTKLL